MFSDQNKAPEYFQTGFDAWVQRWRKCIQRHNDYAEQYFPVEESSGYNLCKFGVYRIIKKELVTMEALLFDPPSYNHYSASIKKWLKEQF